MFRTSNATYSCWSSFIFCDCRWPGVDCLCFSFEDKLEPCPVSRSRFNHFFSDRRSSRNVMFPKTSRRSEKRVKEVSMESFLVKVRGQFQVEQIPFRENLFCQKNNCLYKKSSSSVKKWKKYPKEKKEAEHETCLSFVEFGVRRCRQRLRLSALEQTTTEPKANSLNVQRSNFGKVELIKLFAITDSPQL